MDLRCKGVLIEQQALECSGNFIPETPAKSASNKRNLVSVSNGEGTPAFESLVDIPFVLRCPLTEKSASTSLNRIATPPFARITPSKVRRAQHCKTQEVVHLYTEDVHKKERVKEFEDRTDASSSSEEDEETQEIDLNKIPRNKKVRRKKIRPKVIQDGKQIKSPRPVTPKIAEPKEKPITKKTYVRRKKALNYSEIPLGSTEKNQKNAIPLKTYVRKRKILNPSETPLTKIREEVIKTADQIPKNTTKSVRRSLDFGSEGEAIDECQVSSACGIESAAFEPFNCNPKICSREFYVELAQGMGGRATKSPVGFTFDLNRALNEVLDEYIKLPEDPAPSAQTTENGMNVLNDQKQVSSCTHKDVIIIDDDDDEDEKTEVKRDRDHISVDKHCFIQESLLPQDVCFVHGYKETKQTRSCQVTSSLSPYLPIIYKRRRTQKPKHLRSLSSEDAQWSRNFDMLHQLELTFGPTQRATRKRSALQGRKRIPIAGAEDCEHLLWCPENENCEPQACMDTLFADTRFKITTKRRRSRGYFGLVSSALSNTKQECEIDSSQFSFSLQPFVLGLAASTPRRWKYLKWIQVCSNIPTVATCLDPVDVIVEKMKHIKIGDAQLKTICEAGNALVPYGGDGMLVPHMHLFDMIKKQRPRAKVNLDPETNRVWNLLMGKKSHTEADGVDVDKEKWWEGEREVFRGRADAFIARMHLILGDRRFSKWNGSVVDSVVGVFLTQNVSDHLSSSAFMSLAARFPLRSRGNSREGNEKKIDTSMEREDGSISSPSDTEAIDPGSMGAFEKENEPTDGHGSLGSNNKNGMDYSKDDDLHTNRHENEIGPNQAPQNKMLTMITALQIIDLEEAEDRMTPEDVVSSSTECFGKENIGVLNEGIGPCLLSRASEITELYDVNIMGSDIGQQTTTMGVGSYELTSKLSKHALTCLNTEVCLGKHVTSQGNLPNEKIDDLLRKYDSQELPQLHDEQPVEIQKEKSDIYFQSENIHHEVYMEETAYRSSCNYIEETPETVMASEIILKNEVHNSQNAEPQEVKNASRTVKVNAKADKTKMFDWEDLRKEALDNDNKNERSREAMDSLDWEAVREADVNEISKAIRERGMNNVLAGRIKEFLNRLVKDHGSIDLEWLRNVPPDKAKEYLLSIHGLGLKSVECVRLLTLQHLAFPVDTNVGRICVRLGWVPLQPLPESLQLHLLELYPMIEHIQKYLWPRLCTLDQRTLYELHYQMITFGKVFCTKTKPNCNACPMRGECKHFASAFASARLALPGLEEKRLVFSRIPSTFKNDGSAEFGPISLPQLEGSQPPKGNTRNDEPIIEEPDSPEPICAESLERDIEDAFFEDSEEIPTIKLSLEDFKENLKNYMQENNMEIQDGEMSRALVAITAEATSIPMPKLKNVNRLRTEHQVYELPDSHPLLQGLDERVPDDPCPYLLAIWTPGETAQSTGPPQSCCNFQDSSKLCGRKTCFACNSIQEAEAQTVRGTLLIPCRTATRGSFPLNGTYFQVNEVFADHTSSRIPINVPREWIWNLPRRTVFFGTSVSTIFKGLTLEEIQHCFWRGFVCVRGFDRASRAPRPLYARLHFPPSKAVKTKKASTDEDKGGASSKIL